LNHGIHGRNACSGVTTDETDELQDGFVLRGIWGETTEYSEYTEKAGVVRGDCWGLTTDNTDDTDETQGWFVLTGKWGSRTTKYTKDTKKAGVVWGAVGG
jgi:hypothetical protein